MATALKNKNTSSKAISLENVKMIVKEMKKKKKYHIFPNKISNAKLRNESISEIIIDEEGNVFLMMAKQNHPVMLPQLAVVI